MISRDFFNGFVLGAISLWVLCNGIALILLHFLTILKGPNQCKK